VTRPPSDAQNTDRAALDRLEDIATALHAAPLHADISAFRQRITDGRFFVACLGDFKRGKSTLVNALVGVPVLPMGVTPVTTVPTIVQFGDEPAARIRFATGETQRIAVEQIGAYVSEADNPRNSRGVEVVDVFLPSELLRDGLCLVDTPGLGSVFQQNTNATNAFIPQIDAALVVIGVDPPLSGDELRLLKIAAAQVSHVIVVLNKVDRFTVDERGEALRFAEHVLSAELGRLVDPILEVSATESLSGADIGRDWTRLAERLAALSQHSGRTLVRAALDRGVVRLARLAMREIDETQAALHRPREESDRRLEALQIRPGHLAHQSLLLGFAMTRTAEDLSRDAAERRRQFVHHALPHARSELSDAIWNADVHFGPALRRYALERARAIAQRHLVRWLAHAHEEAEVRYRQTTQHFDQAARATLSQSTQLAELGVGDLSIDLEPAETICVPSRIDPHAIEFPPVPHTTSLQWAVDAVQRPKRVRQRVVDDATAFMEEMFATVARVVDDDFDRRLAQSAQLLQHAVHELLQSVYAAADRAAAHARAVRAEGEEAIQGENRRLAALRGEVKVLMARGVTATSDRISAAHGGPTRA
jgi:GTP-binding protein EngB required for normal cell division